MVSKLTSDNKNFLSVAVYDLPSMKLNTGLSKSYMDVTLNSSSVTEKNTKKSNNNTIMQTVSNEEKGEDVILQLGTYEVGVDIKAGKYDIIAKSGTGNVITKGSTYNSIMLSTNETEYYDKKYNNLILKEGDTIEILSKLEILLQAK